MSSPTKEKSIIFSTSMIQAILNGNKTQTRRVIKPCSTATLHDGNQPDWVFTLAKCPYGQVGDRLWVRETFGYGGDGRLYYKTDYSGDNKPFNPIAPGWHDVDHWTPSIHMPRWASRITREITEVRAERVQDIRFADCIAEGIKFMFPYVSDVWRDFRELWDSLNAKYKWEVNPWVWVISFRRLD